MMRLERLVKILDSELRLADFGGDVSNNGLQIEGTAEVERAVFAVDAAQATIDFAVDNNAQMLFVHHGLSWGGSPRRWRGVEGRRFGTLFRNGISLYAAHLPLDAHCELGNNAVLAKILKLEKIRPFFQYDGVKIGFAGELPVPAAISGIAGVLSAVTGGVPVWRGDENKPVRRVAVVSGGGDLDALEQAAGEKCELLVTGELTHIMHHYALESGVAVLALGHYASETCGPRAVMDFISKECGIETLFADFPTGL